LDNLFGGRRTMAEGVSSGARGEAVNVFTWNINTPNADLTFLNGVGSEVLNAI
jgi:hypothetical protein